MSELLLSAPLGTRLSETTNFDLFVIVTAMIGDASSNKKQANRQRERKPVRALLMLDSHGRLNSSTTGPPSVREPTKLETANETSMSGINGS